MTMLATPAAGLPQQASMLEKPSATIKPRTVIHAAMMPALQHGLTPASSAAPHALALLQATLNAMPPRNAHLPQPAEELLIHADCQTWEFMNGSPAASALKPAAQILMIMTAMGKRTSMIRTARR